MSLITPKYCQNFFSKPPASRQVADLGSNRDRFTSKERSDEVYHFDYSPREQAANDRKKYFNRGALGAAATRTVTYFGAGTTPVLRAGYLNTVLNILAAGAVGVGVYRLARRLLGRTINPGHVETQARLNDPENNFEKVREHAWDTLTGEGMILKRFTLRKGDHEYDAFMVGTEETFKSDNWVSVHQGYTSISEDRILHNSKYVVDKFKANVLYVNGPGLGRSDGYPLVEHMADAQEVSLRFLADVAKAKKIATFAFSIGGGTVGKAYQRESIQSLLDEKKVEVLPIWALTFDKLRNAASDRMGTRLVGDIFRLMCNDFDNIAAVRKLRDRGVAQIVIQKTKDHDTSPPKIDADSGIGEACALAKALQNAGELDKDGISFIGHPDIKHEGEPSYFDALPVPVQGKVNAAITDFFTSKKNK